MHEAVSETSVVRASAKAVSPKPRRRLWRPVLAWLFVIAILATAVYYGVKIRRWAWDQTTDIRFLNAVSNAIEWGRHANKIGVLNVYDELVSQHGAEGDYNGPARFALDYAPARLFIATAWAKWAAEKYPPPEGKPLVWRPEYEFTQPMLRLNLACELLAMAGMFLLVYHWVRVSRTPPPPRWWKLALKDAWGRNEASTRDLPSTVGLFSATVAALLIWFNPGVIFNAHVYPQWDSWVLPAFIFAIYFGLRNWWLPAGIVVGVCAMAKGQILFALPVLIAWPLLLGNVGGVLRVLTGVAVGIALIVWPFLLQNYEATLWLVYVSIGACMLAVAAVLPRSNWKWQVARGTLVFVALCLVAYHVAEKTGVFYTFNLLGTPVSLHRRATLLTVIGLSAAAALVGGRRYVPTILAGLPAVCTLLTMALLNASVSWILVGIIYPTRHWKQLFWCHGANLGSLLQLRFRWKYQDAVDLSWLPGLGLTDPVPLRQVMMTLYVVMLALVIVAIVRHRRRHDPKLLLAIAVPFMLAYTFLPQMIERYLIWPAAILSAYAALSFGALALWLSLSLAAVILMASYIMPFVRESPMSKEWLPVIRPFFPDIAWGIIVIAIVMLYMALKPSRPRAQAPEAPAPDPDASPRR